MQPTAAAETADVVVVGAGPAGSAAAVALSRLGRQVTVVDRAVFPRDKCCGDGLTTAALRRLEHLGLDPASVASWQPVEEVVVVSAGRRRIDMALPGPGAYSVSARRVDLDAALVDLARSAGAKVVEGHGVSGVSPAPAGDGVLVDLDDGRRLAARYVIAADGMWSPVRRLLGLTDPGYLGEWQAGREYRRASGAEARKLWVWFDRDLAPGYAWSFPLPGGVVNIGYGVLRAPAPDGDRDGGPRLRGQRIDWSERPHVAEVLGADSEPVSPWRAWPIPARIGRATTAALQGRILFAGDAVGACDPMTGEGIAQALETGEMAARAVAQAGPDRPAAAAARYRRQIGFGMAVDDALARRLSWVLTRPTAPERALAVAGASAWTRRNFVRWMFEDYPRAVLATPHRWQRGMLTGPGAYR